MHLLATLKNMSKEFGQSEKKLKKNINKIKIALFISKPSIMDSDGQLRNF
mgnify:FL=1